MATAPSNISELGPGPQENENPIVAVAQCFLAGDLDDDVAELVEFLLHKYRTQEPITKEDMLNHLSRIDQDAFPSVFSQASECMQMVFGIDVEEIEPCSESYFMTNTLGLTLNGTVSRQQCLPKTGLLINVLGAIFMDDNHAPEENIWELLNVMGVYAGEEHFLYGEPKELLTEEWVRQKYLVYQQVPGSQPARYEFQWGPRAQAEVSKVKLLDHLAQINGSMPPEILMWYEDVLKEESRERGQDTNEVSANEEGNATGQTRAPKVGKVKKTRARKASRASRATKASGRSRCSRGPASVSAPDPAAPLPQEECEQSTPAFDAEGVC